MQIIPQKLPSSLSNSTDQKSNVMMASSSSLPTLKLNSGQNPKLNWKRNHTFLKKAGPNAGGYSNK